MSDEIPFHVQGEIIKRLPVVSLLQFRSVSKAWKSLIESSDFITAHSVAQPQHLLFSSKDLVNTWENFVCVVDDETFPHQQRFVHTLPPSVRPLKQSFLVGSSHGLLCFHGYYGEGENYRPILETETVVIWNPSIRKSITVRVPNNVLDKSNLHPEIQLGFGVCPVSGDPKIVQITKFSNETSYFSEAKVYNVSSGKWTSLSTNLPTKPFRIFWPQVIIDRFIYWCALGPMAIEKGPYHNMIMSFDITNENFGAIDLPDSFSHQPPSQLCISKLKESIVILEYDSSVKSACGVWMMEDGDEKSFTKLFNVEAPELSRTIITILGFRESGQTLMEVENGHEYIEQSEHGPEYIEQSELVVYEPNSERFNYLEIYGKADTFSVNFYIETLLLLGRSDYNV